MTPIEFPEMNCTYAKDQPEYLPLPAHRMPNNGQSVISCWQGTWWDRILFLFTGKIWLEQMTFGARLQPQLPSIEKPEYLEVVGQKF